MNTEILDLLTRWTERTQMILEREIDRFGIGDTGALKDSLESQVRAKSEAILESELQFLVRGRFRDMGVGRGSRAGRIETRAGNRARASTSGGRKPARWYSRAFWARLNDLQGAIGYQLMESSIQVIKGQLDLVK
jgi:hypothetical protein